MNAFDQELNDRLAALRAQGLERELRRVDSPQSPHVRVNGQNLLNFSSNDYLGLANDPALKAAAIQAIERFGTGTGASRLVCGSLAVHHELEEALAAFKGLPAALTFSTGYATALGTICALLGSDDVIVLDKLVHASIVDAARLCGAKLRVFAHNDLNDLERILQWTARRSGNTISAPARKSRTLIVTESVFSMDGDQAPLRELVELKDHYGAWLMVDEAHATGLFGAHGRGLAEELGVSERLEIQMGTLGKALGAAGGYVCGSRPLVDFLVNRARSFIFSTAPVPAAAAAATAGIRLAQSAEGEQRRARLWQLLAQLLPHLTAQPGRPKSAILPLVIGDETQAVQAAACLREHHIFIPAIRYPTVARGAARLRLTLTAAHSSADLEELLAVLQALQLTPRTPRLAVSPHAPAG
ncbi:MAG TPA: 8-amino-7-oxononanoate synthase [Bacillota bacterium]|nr:8-amino-7-oxononanoate synthase [Bacillota bacterium]